MKKIKPFNFKQFQIFQDKTAMKVGTDGVLLGAWSKLHEGFEILDIGTGTGLISLMLAQRYPLAMIDGIELDEDAFLQASDNCRNSPFKDAIQITKTSLQEFKTEKKYDLIVSNPPFFSENDRVELDARKQARQQATLTFEELLDHTTRLLSPTGFASFIIPFDQEKEFILIAENLHLIPNRIVRVKGNKEALFKRSLIELSYSNNEPEISEIIIEVDRHVYTQDYIDLTRDFYLKM